MVWHGGLTLHYFRIILLYFFKKYNITQVLNKASFTLRQKANTLCTHVFSGCRFPWQRRPGWLQPARAGNWAGAPTARSAKKSAVGAEQSKNFN